MLSRADEALARLATSRHGVVARGELLAAGFTKRMIDHRVSVGWLRRLYPGIYQVGGAPSSWHSEIAACALWSRGAAAGTSAAYLHGFPGFERPTDPEVVTTRDHRVMPRHGIRARHTSWLPDEQVVEVDGIPCTSPERTVMDLFGFWSQRKAAIALDHTLHRGLTTLASYDWCLFLTARRGRNGCGRLREAVRARAGLTEFPNSPLKTVVLQMLLDNGLPRPILQFEIRDANGLIARPDFVYPDEKVVVEAHSRLWHEGLALRERDRRRHERMVALEYRVIYVGWSDAIERSHATSTLIRSALASPLPNPRQPRYKQALVTEGKS